MNLIARQDAEKVVECLKLGLSLRKTAAATGIDKNTVHRYKRISAREFDQTWCACGLARGHRGWCAFKLRQIFAAKWTFGATLDLKLPVLQTLLPNKQQRERVEAANYPYLRGEDKTGAMIEAVNAVVPRLFPNHMRADICQDLLLAILEGEATIQTLKDGSAKAIRKYYKLHPGKFGPVSLDAPVRGTENLRIGDLIANDAPHF